MKSSLSWAADEKRAERTVRPKFAPSYEYVEADAPQKLFSRKVFSFGDAMAIDIAPRPALRKEYPRRLSLQLIQEMVSKRAHVNILQHGQTPRLSTPRHVAMYLARQMGPWSLSQIGKALGNYHHTTVVHAIQSIADLMEREPEVRKVVEDLRKEITERVKVVHDV